MQGTKQIVWNAIRWVIALPLLLSCNIALAESGVHIAIVKSSNNSYFNQTIQTLINKADKAAHFRVLELEASSGNPALLQDSDLIIAVGASATQAIISEYPEKSLISAYLTQQQYNDLKLQNKYHRPILLDQPLERYLAFSQLVLNAKSIGIVDQTQITLTRKQHLLLKQLEVNLRQYQPEEYEQPLTRIRQLIGQNDTLLMLPNQKIYNRDTLKGILLTTYRSRTPVISYSPAHVKSGALASIYSSPTDIGQQLGEMLNQFLVHKKIHNKSPQFARYYSILFNQRVAHALGIILPDDETLRLRLDEALK